MTLQYLVEDVIIVFIPGLFASRLLHRMTWRWSYILIRLPGTIAHEMLHYAVGLILNARPCRFSILPIKSGENYILGSVSFKNITWYNGIFVGMAPLLLWVPLLFLLPKSAQPDTYLMGYWCLLALCIEPSMPSRTDLSVAAKSLIPVFCFCMVICSIYFGFFR